MLVSGVNKAVGWRLFSRVFLAVPQIDYLLGNGNVFV